MVDRSAVVAELADQIWDAVCVGDIWRPNYTELMAATGRKRSWCEKVVHDARNAVLEVPARGCNDDRTVLRDARHPAAPIATAALSVAYQPLPSCGAGNRAIERTASGFGDCEGLRWGC